MRIIVAGGSRLAEQVAGGLQRAGEDVTVIDTDGRREVELARAGLRVVLGDPLVPSTLEAAGALRADVLVACTPSDEENLVIAVLAKRHFNVNRVVASVNEPVNQPLFDARWGVDELVSPSHELISLIRRAPEGSA